jgi:hypothetical protein
MVSKLWQKGYDNFVTLFGDLFITHYCHHFVDLRSHFFDKIRKLFPQIRHLFVPFDHLSQKTMTKRSQKGGKIHHFAMRGTTKKQRLFIATHLASLFCWQYHVKIDSWCKNCTTNCEASIQQNISLWIL